VRRNTRASYVMGRRGVGSGWQSAERVVLCTRTAYMHAVGTFAAKTDASLHVLRVCLLAGVCAYPWSWRYQPDHDRINSRRAYEVFSVWPTKFDVSHCRFRVFAVQMHAQFTPPTRRNYTWGEVTSQSLWSRYDRHVVGITWLMCGVKRRRLMELFTKN